MKWTSGASIQGKPLHSCSDSIPLPATKGSVSALAASHSSGSFPSIVPHSVISTITEKEPSFSIYPSLALIPFFWFLIVTLLKTIAYIITVTFFPHSLLSLPLLMLFLAKPETDFPAAQSKVSFSPHLSGPISSNGHSRLFPSWNGFILASQIPTYWLLLLLSSCGSSESLPGSPCWGVLSFHP